MMRKVVIVIVAIILFCLMLESEPVQGYVNNFIESHKMPLVLAPYYNDVGDKI